MTIDTNALKGAFGPSKVPTDLDFSNLIDLASLGQNAVIDNHNNTITANGASYDLSKSGLTPLQTVSSGSFNDLPLGTVFVDSTTVTDGPDTIHAFTTTTFYSSIWNGRKAQIAIADNTNLMYFRTFIGDKGIWNGWTKLADDSEVVHNSAIDQDVMVKHILTADDDVLLLDPGTYYAWGATPKNYPTDAVSYARVVVKMLSPDGLPNFTNVDNKIVEVFDANSTQMINVYQGGGPAWSGWELPNSGTMATKSDVTTAISAATATKADDSKVAHLSGANNFDTVPTYGTNNKPFAINDTGATTARPKDQAVGYQYYDTDLKKPIWYNGSAWTDSTGATV